MSGYYQYIIPNYSLAMGIGYPAIPTTSDLIIGGGVEEGRLLGLAQSFHLLIGICILGLVRHLDALFASPEWAVRALLACGKVNTFLLEVNLRHLMSLELLNFKRAAKLRCHLTT